jgi:transposase-like protein
MNNHQCLQCQKFLYEVQKDNQNCQRYICSECGNITFLTFQHQVKKPEGLMILTDRQYRSLLENTQHLGRIPEKENIQQVLEEIQRNN